MPKIAKIHQNTYDEYPGRTYKRNRHKRPDGDIDVNGTLMVSPFWVCPGNLMPHNIYVANNLPLYDTTVLQGNMLATGGILVASGYFKNGLVITIGGMALLWSMWLLNFPKGSREMLSSRDIKLRVIGQ